MSALSNTTAGQGPLPVVGIVIVPNEESDMPLAGIAKPRAQHYDPGHIDQQVIGAMAAFIKKPLANRTATASY